jgi:hypothetical protein
LSTPGAPEMAIGPCFRCDQWGHLQADCPELLPAKTYAEHLARIAEYGQRFASGKWLIWEKRKAIEAENKMWNAQAAAASRR